MKHIEKIDMSEMKASDEYLLPLLLYIREIGFKVNQLCDAWNSLEEKEDKRSYLNCCDACKQGGLHGGLIHCLNYLCDCHKSYAKSTAHKEAGVLTHTHGADCEKCNATLVGRRYCVHCGKSYEGEMCPNKCEGYTPCPTTQT